MRHSSLARHRNVRPGHADARRPYVSNRLHLSRAEFAQSIANLIYEGWAVVGALLVSLIAPIESVTLNRATDSEVPKFGSAEINSPTEGGTLTVKVQRNKVNLDSPVSPGI